MKTALFVGTFMHGKDYFCDLPRMQRIIKHLIFYSAIKEDLGFSQIYVSDNGGNSEQIGYLLDNFPEIELIRHPYLPRGEGHPVYDQLPCWRTVYDYRKVIADGFEKIIITDDDAFIVSKRLMNFVKDLRSGWNVTWCPKYDFPECSMSVLCEDAFDTYFEFTEDPYEAWNKNPEPIEKLLPYTSIFNTFKCDRWGETHTPQEPWMDGYFQCPVDLELTPRMDLNAPVQTTD